MIFMEKEKKIMDYLNTHSRVIAVDGSTYTLESGDVIEHGFELPENITVEEFQRLLDNAKSTIMGIIGNGKEE